VLILFPPQIIAQEQLACADLVAVKIAVSF